MIINMSSKSLRNTFYISIIEDKISLFPSEIDNNIDATITHKIKNKIGDKCYKQGFISKNSIKLVERSIGRIKSSHFNGNIIFDVKIEVKICNPLENDIIECTVVGKNKMGILATNYPLVVALSKLHHDDTTKFDQIKKDDVIKVVVICSKFELNDNEISVIGKLSE